MSSLIRPVETEPLPRRSGPLLFAGCVIAGLVAFLLTPGEIVHKSHALLHGLCAQRPSHSFRMGADVLPVDARMTGIYLGAAFAITWLALTGRLRATGPMPKSVAACLVLFAIAMVVDGFNALLFDLDLPRLYAPSNTLRFITGGLAGTTMGVVLGHLFAISIWRHGEREHALVASPRHLAAPLLMTAVLGSLAMTGWPVLYTPFAAGLVVASIGVFWLLGTVLVALISDRAWKHERFSELAGIATAGLLAAFAIVGLLAGFRFAVEAYLGLPKLT